MQRQEIEHQDTSLLIRNMDELIEMTNKNLGENIYIADDVFIPETKNIARCYRSDFTLKTRKEANKLTKTIITNSSIPVPNADFFVYNEKTQQLLPFKKNDYLIYEHGYLTFDGEHYLSYDDNGKEIGRWSYTHKRI